MTAQVLDEFQVLGKYRVCVLDAPACLDPHAFYRINGEVYEPVPIHSRKAGDTMPRNYIAFRSTKVFKGATVEFLRRSDYLRLVPRAV